MSFVRSLALLFLLLSGCASSRGPSLSPSTAGVEGFPHHALEDVMERVMEDREAFSGLQGRGELVLNSPSQNGRFGLHMLASAEGRVLIAGSAFGIEGVRALVRPDSFFLYNRLENTLTLGATTDATALLPLPTDAASGFAVLLGMHVDASQAWTMSARDGVYVLLREDGREALQVDARLWRVIRSVSYGESGELVEERLWGDFRAPGSGHPAIPHTLSIHRPAERLRAVMSFASLVANPENTPPARLNVPSGVRLNPIP